MPKEYNILSRNVKVFFRKIRSAPKPVKNRPFYSRVDKTDSALRRAIKESGGRKAFAKVK
jgi:hypothetical protein